MRIRFWGVRGSIPAPVIPSQIKNKIAIILENVTPDDIKNKESREQFLESLPLWLYGTVGGNTPCVSVEAGDPLEYLIFDAGSGIREMGFELSKLPRKLHEYHLFLSHFHWDHLQGFPFFYPAYDPGVTINFYSPEADLESVLQGQMQPPYFPVRIDSMGSKKNFFFITEDVTIGGLKVSFKKLKHPNDSFSYQVREGNRRFIYATDTELTADFINNKENRSFFYGADLIVIDTQYTLGEAIEKYNWGHSSFSLAVEFASHCNIKHMVFFHHDPSYDDRKLFNNLHAAKWYREKLDNRSMKLSLAVEGEEIIL
ncbi:MBL fold metallo-hydrolase [Breznakiellaceae bacterium SP9]